MAFDRSRTAKGLLAALTMMCAALATHAAPGVRATVDRTVVPVGEAFTLSITVEGVATSSAPTLPAMPGVSVAGVSSRNEFVIDNNQRSSKQVFDYQVIPTQPGDLNIPSIAIQAGGRIFQTLPIAVKVLQAGAAPNPQAAATNLALMRLIAPKREAYVGEAFPVEIHLYWQHGTEVRDVRMPQLKATGFSATPFGQPQATSTVLNGMHYSLAVFRTAITPARTGDLALGPAECQLTLLVPIQNQRQRTIFEIFGPSMQSRPMVVQSESHAIRVLPLPAENVPDSFNGAVGTYNLSVSAGPTNLAVGDPITVRVQISGRGQLDALNLPPQPQWRDFKAYAPNSKVEPTDPLGLSGAKTFEQVIAPENHEIRTLPPFQFSFFDPGAKAYRTLTGPTIPLAIRPSISAPAPPMLTNPAAQSAPPPPIDDIIHIRARFEPIAMAHPPLVEQPWFLGLQAVPVIAWLSLFIARKRKETLANNPRLRRQRAAAARVREGLRELPQHAAARRAEDFFATVFRLLQEQLGARLDLPASGITEAVIDQQLRDRNVPPSTLGELRDLFQACNQARYAPHRSSEELSSYIPRVQNVLRDLEAVAV